MEPLHHLKALLQYQLATDASSVLNLPFVLSSLTQEHFLPSPHLSKWTTRINSLLHSKDAGARWAGLCIAHRTSNLSRSTMIESAQSWLGATLPLLSKNEPSPTLKAAIRLLWVIFSAGTGTPEYQRQVVTPNIPKFTAAAIAIAENDVNEELRVLIMATLSRLILLYPNLHRPSHTALSTLALRSLSGSAPNPTSHTLLESASRLYTVLHFTGGKVGAATLWRNSVDETLAFGWNAFSTLRSTFIHEGPHIPSSSSIDEALINVPLQLDKLRCCTIVLCDLLRTTTPRLVQVPLGPLVKFISSLLSCTVDDKAKDNVDLSLHAMETSVIPEFWRFGCEIASCLSRCVGPYLTPHATRLISYLTYHLEQNINPSQRFYILTAVQALLAHCHLSDSPLVPTRLAKAVLPSLSILLVAPSETQTTEESSQSSKKGKKRARGYEGDEVFRLTKELICPGPIEGKVLLSALEVVRLVLRNPNLSPAMQSISARVLLSILLALPELSPASLSTEPKLHTDLLQLVKTINTELGSGTSSVMSKSLGLVLRTVMLDDNYTVLRDMDILVHPRAPPLVRSLPHVESLSLFRAEESQEEAQTREELGLHGAFPLQPKKSDSDVVMEDAPTQLQATKSTNEVQPATILEPLAPPRPPVPISSIANEPGPAPAPQTTKPVPIRSEPSRIQPPEAKKIPQPVPARPQPTVAPTQTEEVEDEEMPSINMESDSDEE